jgi:hypothetical protein
MTWYIMDHGHTSGLTSTIKGKIKNKRIFLSGAGIF